MFGVGFNELLIILVVALIVLGPDKLPELARTLGKGLAEIKRATGAVTQSVVTDSGLKETTESLKKSLKVDTGLSRESLNTLFQDIKRTCPPQVSPGREGQGGVAPGSEPAAATVAQPASGVDSAVGRFTDDDAD
ncbi:MAG: Sec-independent protein translocase protein TatB [Pseudomonadota bacterium]